MLSVQIINVKTADAKARAHSEKLLEAALDSGTELDVSLSLTDEAQRLVTRLDHDLKLEAMMHSREA